MAEKMTAPSLTPAIPPDTQAGNLLFLVAAAQEGPAGWTLWSACAGMNVWWRRAAAVESSPALVRPGVIRRATQEEEREAAQRGIVNENGQP